MGEREREIERGERERRGIGEREGKRQIEREHIRIEERAFLSNTVRALRPRITLNITIKALET